MNSDLNNKAPRHAPKKRAEAENTQKTPKKPVQRTGHAADAPSARAANVRAQALKSEPSKKTAKKPAATSAASGVIAVLAMICGIFAAGFGFLVRGVKKANRKLDVFRKTEIQKAVTNSILAAILLTVVIAVFGACFPGIRMGWGRTLAAFGADDKAARIAVKAEKSGYDSEKVMSLRLKIAKGYLEDGRFDDALSMLLLTKQDDKDTILLTEKVRTAKAEKLYKDGKYEEASRIFYLLSDDETALSRYYDSLCAVSVQAYLNGNEAESHKIMMSVSGAGKRIARVLTDVTGDKKKAQELLLLDSFKPETLDELEKTIQAVLEAKSNMTESKIAAGNRHTVGLTSDGRVVSAGDNYFGQTNVSEWTDITSVAAGAWHTAGLKSDGTVVAVGDNSEGQLEVSDWTDIVMIACTDYDTIGLKKDGTIVFCGMHDFKEASGWKNVTMITGGAYSIGALYGQGTMLSSNVSAQMKAGYLFADLSVSGACSAGIMYDGTFVSSFENAPAWENVASVEVSSTAIFAITTDGELKSYFFRESDDPKISVSKKVADVVSSGTHHVVLFEDGTVQAFGLNDLGQSNVGDWQL